MCLMELIKREEFSPKDAELIMKKISSQGTLPESRKTIEFRAKIVSKILDILWKPEKFLALMQSEWVGMD